MSDTATAEAPITRVPQNPIECIKLRQELVDAIEAASGRIARANEQIARDTRRVAAIDVRIAEFTEGSGGDMDKAKRDYFAGEEKRLAELRASLGL